MKILRKNQKEMLEISNTVTEMRKLLMGSSVDWTWLEEESLSWRIYQQKLPKVKSKEKRD